MANFSFTNNYSAAVTSLQTVDEEICKDIKAEVKPEEYHQKFNLVIETGFAILMSQGGSYVTEITFNDWLKLLKQPISPDTELLLRKYLYGKYKFTGWR